MLSLKKVARFIEYKDKYLYYKGEGYINGKECSKCNNRSDRYYVLELWRYSELLTSTSLTIYTMEPVVKLGGLRNLRLLAKTNSIANVFREGYSPILS